LEQHQVIKLLLGILNERQVLTGAQLADRYVHIWEMDQPLLALVLVLPETTQQVSDILRICNEHLQPVIIHGGLTNLVGGTQSSPNQVVLSMERMNHILETDASSRTITVEAGVILEQVIAQAAQHDLLFPLNFGAKGTAQVGGILSTNAGGLRVLKYGMTRNLVLGLEVVLADGTILSNLKKLIKDNSGYDLKQLFIGAEGTLGVITKAVFRLQERPTSRISAWVGVNSFEQVVLLLKRLDKALAGKLAGFELVWRDTFMAMTTPADMRAPLPYDYHYYVLTECLGNAPEADQELLEATLAALLEAGIVEDAVVARSEADLNWFWRIREDVRILSAQANNDQHFDISLPIPDIGKTMAAITGQLNAVDEVEVVYRFGHLADGNIHLIIGKSNNSKLLTEQINVIVYGPIKALGGSVSAEHGIGIDKKSYLHHSKSIAEIEVMKRLKRALDPNGILNPGRIF